ncbi:MAG: rod shape-determining protein MreC [Defluviitaleaceae bacterium]|nr:rod shape-determining protein MreC [Defluviitaleaceae bacterium]
MEYLHRYKRLFIIGLLMLCVVLMAFTGRQNYQQGWIRSSAMFIVSSGQTAFASIGGWFADRFEFLTNMNSLHAENQLLVAEVVRLQTELNRLHHLDDEIRIMAELVNLNRRYEDYAVLGADIISRNPSNWSSSFTINRGSNDGIAVNMAVLAPDGLAGRVSSVGFNYAAVMPIIEDGSAVAAQSLRTGEGGVVSGDINLSSRGLLRMNHIELTATIDIGDAIISSGTSSIFPPGILIGHVTEMGQTAGVSRYAIITPSVDFARLSAVLVITDLFDLFD